MAIRKNEAIAIGNRIEMFVDEFLVANKANVALRMNPPERREVSLAMDKPWEGPGSGIFSVVFADNGLYRMFYRATFPNNENDRSATQGCAYAESTDGITWTKPELGLIPYEGHDTNMVFAGPNAHNFSPFLDPKPGCSPDEKYKAIAGHHPEGLQGYKSADCIHWEPIQSTPLITKGAFDSHNLAFFDPNRNEYVCYSRYFLSPDTAINVYSGVRAIQHNYSNDFRSWSEPEPNTYDEGVPFEHFYTNATTLCPGAEHMYFSFPMRFLPERHKVREHGHVGVSDNVIMTSRDGRHWNRPFLESWVKPGLDQRNWTERNLIVARGIIETGSEFSLYINENYRWDTSCIRRVSVGRYRFGSMHADRAGGVFVTKPIVFDGDTLSINYATSAPGSVRVGIVAETGWPLSHYSTEDCDVIYGDELERTVTWRGSADLSFLKGKAIRFKFQLVDAALFALRVV